MYQNFPKVELHAHINGSVSDSTIRKLVSLKRTNNPNCQPSNEWEVVLENDSKRTMKDAFDAFRLIHTLSDTENAAYMITTDVIKDFEAENVKYLELRTTPRQVEATNMTKESYISTVLQAIKNSLKRPDCDIIVKLLLAIDRRTTLEDAWDTLELAERLNSSDDYKGMILGLDLSGDPYKGDARLFIPVFEAAKKKGFKLALHLSEVKGQNDETNALLALPPDRIGHGTFLHPECGGSEMFINTIRKHNIPIEFCFTSNMTTSTVSHASDHHFGFWHNKGHPCLICTDDKGVFATSLTEEFQIAAESFNLTKKDMWNITYESIDHIFADDTVKDKLRQHWIKTKEKSLED